LNCKCAVKSGSRCKCTKTYEEFLSLKDLKTRFALEKAKSSLQAHKRAIEEDTTSALVEKELKVNGFENISDHNHYLSNPGNKFRHALVDLQNRLTFGETLLTKILKGSLAGLKNKLILIGTPSSQDVDYVETKSALKYVSLATSISNGRNFDCRK
jgi:hypothetical protein